MTKSLQQIGLESKTDKAYLHGYCDLYEESLSHLKDKKIRLLEIGIQGENSIQMWREHLPNAEIHGIDVLRIKPTVKDVTYHVLDAEKLNQLEEFSRTQGIWDVIIDDGGHTMKQQQFALKMLWRNLKAGGIFIMEDLHTSFPPRRWTHNPELSPTTYQLVESLQSGTGFRSPYFENKDYEEISKEVEKVVIWWKGHDVGLPVEKSTSITSLIYKK